MNESHSSIRFYLKSQRTQRQGGGEKRRGDVIYRSNKKQFVGVKLYRLINDTSSLVSSIFTGECQSLLPIRLRNDMFN